MPRSSFFKELKRRDICPACKEGRHKECALEFCLDPYEKSTQRQCRCDCQLTPGEIRNREQARRINNHTKE